MRTRTTIVYTFAELSEEAKRKALELLYDINVNFDWWEYTYEDAKTIGCEINGFDIDRGSYCELKCKDARETARLIVENHGETCGTRKLADEYLKDYTEKMSESERDEHGDFIEEPDFGDLDAAFERALGEEYLSMLRQEYEYQTSEEAILETIEANEYEFTEEGRQR
jgi:hypothetical protein